MGRAVNAMGPRCDCGCEASEAQQLFSTERSRVILLHGDVTEHSISMAVSQLLMFADQSTKPVNIIISTYGGSTDEMFCLYDTMKFLPCPIHTIALGKVMSAGVLLLASGAKGKRLIGKSARIMMHTMSSGVWGSTLDIVTHADEVKRLQHQFNQALCNETKMSEQQIIDIMKSGLDRYLTPHEALKYGIVDQVIGE
jgi:ATP-dependent Clp protease, protease subunit